MTQPSGARARGGARLREGLLHRGLADAFCEHLASQEEYANVATLEQRLQTVARKMVNPAPRPSAVSALDASESGVEGTRAGAVATGDTLGAPGPDGSQAQLSQPEHAEVVRQQRWLILLRHASKCPHNEGQCPYTPHCHVARTLWEHVLGCQNQACPFPRCFASRELLRHHQRCTDTGCPVCGPVLAMFHNQRLDSFVRLICVLGLCMRSKQRIVAVWQRSGVKKTAASAFIRPCAECGAHS